MSEHEITDFRLDVATGPRGWWLGTSVVVTARRTIDGRVRKSSVMVYSDDEPPTVAHVGVLADSLARGIFLDGADVHPRLEAALREHGVQIAQCSSTPRPTSSPEG